jgi:hypothetical protein
MKRMMLSAALVLAALSCSANAGERAIKSGWAVVNSDGSLARGSNTTGGIHLGTGIYEVDFANSVKSCVYTATIGQPGSDGTNVPGTVTVAGRGNNANGVYIRTYDQSGASSDSPFHLNVRC